MNKIFLLLVFFLVFTVTPVFAYHEDDGVIHPTTRMNPWDSNHKFFEMDGYKIRVTNNLATDVDLVWNEHSRLPSGMVTLSEEFTGDVKLMIPKEMPRTMNLDFGSSFYVFDRNAKGYGDSAQVREYETKCEYVLVLPFDSEKSVAFDSVSVATGRWDPVIVKDAKCVDIYYNLKQSPTKDNSLKQQIADYISKERIECANIEHVLVERPNKKLACIEHHTLDKLDWKILNLPDVYVKSTYQFKHETKFIYVEYMIKNGIVTDMQTDGYGLFVNLVASEKGTLDITLPSIAITPESSDCAKSGYMQYDFMVLTYGEETIFNHGAMYTEYPTLSIPFDQGVSQLEIASLCVI